MQFKARAGDRAVPVRSGRVRRALAELERLDLALYRAVADTRGPALDAALARVSQAGMYSRISVGVALVLALAGGRTGTRAAVQGMASVGVTAAVVNLPFKPLMRRRPPDRKGLFTAGRPRVTMPSARSFPSGHTAAAFAFATGAGRELAWTRPPLYALAALIGYSRVHAGVHYPLDVIGGALAGVAVGELMAAFIQRTEDSCPTDSRAPQRQANPSMPDLNL
jgi:membrane-associated phospholipid phosphatase